MLLRKKKIGVIFHFDLGVKDAVTKKNRYDVPSWWHLIFAKLFIAKKKTNKENYLVVNRNAKERRKKNHQKTSTTFLV